MKDDSKSEVFAAIEVMVGAASRSTVVDGSTEREERRQQDEDENTEDIYRVD